MIFLVKIALGVAGTLVALNVLMPNVGQRVQHDLKGIALISGFIAGIVLGVRGN